MTNKEAAIVLKQYVSNNFKISGLYAFLHPTINPDKRKTHIESILTDGSLIRHTLRKTYRLILEDYVFGDYDINKLYCFLQPEIAEECKEEYANALLRTAMENAYAALNNCDD